MRLWLATPPSRRVGQGRRTHRVHCRKALHHPVRHHGPPRYPQDSPWHSHRNASLPAMRGERCCRLHRELREDQRRCEEKKPGLLLPRGLAALPLHHHHQVRRPARKPSRSPKGSATSVTLRRTQALFTLCATARSHEPVRRSNAYICERSGVPAKQCLHMRELAERVTRTCCTTLQKHFRFTIIASLSAVARCLQPHPESPEALNPQTGLAGEPFRCHAQGASESCHNEHSYSSRFLEPRVLFKGF